MSELLQSFFDNDSVFGRFMTRIGILIGANLMFVLFSLPVFTGGAAFTALYHVMFKLLREDGVLNPFREFWQGFRSNFKQSTIYWCVLLLLIAFGYMDVRFCAQMGGILTFFQYGIYSLGLIALVVTLYLFPVIAAFENTLLNQIKSAFYFAVHNIRSLIVILFCGIFPMVVTYMDLQYQPLYAFCWCTFGFAALAMLGAKLLPDFKPYLDSVSNVPEEKSEKEILEEMKKLGM